MVARSAPEQGVKPGPGRPRGSTSKTNAGATAPVAVDAHLAQAAVISGAGVGIISKRPRGRPPGSKSKPRVVPDSPLTTLAYAQNETVVPPHLAAADMDHVPGITAYHLEDAAFKQGAETEDATRMLPLDSQEPWIIKKGTQAKVTTSAPQVDATSVLTTSLLRASGSVKAPSDAKANEPPGPRTARNRSTQYSDRASEGPPRSTIPFAPTRPGEALGLANRQKDNLMIAETIPGTRKPDPGDAVSGEKYDSVSVLGHPSTTEKKKRGRPNSAPSVHALHSGSGNIDGSGMSTLRPKMMETSVAASPPPLLAGSPSLVPQKRGPGRPRKVREPESALTVESPPVHRKRGRPKKTTNDPSAVTVAVEAEQGAHTLMLRPERVTESVPKLPAKRGRPRKDATVASRSSIPLLPEAPNQIIPS